jgi:hypothetical protein
MSASNDDCKRELECLRLASDLMRLASDTSNPPFEGSLSSDGEAMVH